MQKLMPSCPERRKQSMGMMENSAIVIPSLLLRKTVVSLLDYADKSSLILAEKYRLVEIFRYLLITSFLLFLRLFPSLFPSYSITLRTDDLSFNPRESSYLISESGIGDSGIAWALLQLLSSVNDIPVSSRKYGIVRSLAERLIEDNNREDIEALREINRTALSSAFSRTLCRVEAAMAELGHDWVVGPYGDGSGLVHYQLNRVLRVVRSVGDGVWGWVGRGSEDVNRSADSAEKLVAELLWLAEKLAACGFVEEAVERWASASNLARISLLAEPRLQGSLLMVSAFLFKQSKFMGLEETDEASGERLRQTKMKMLTSWLPLLCRASNGIDMPVLSLSERAELEKILEEAIGMLGHEEQEQVLSLWLHHFTYCPSSDWPNLYASYARWCTTSRKLFF